MIFRFTSKIQKYWNDHLLIATISVFLFLFLFLTMIHLKAGGDPVVGDHYFHFKYAHLLRTEGWDVVKSFDWISPSGEIGNGGRYTINLFQISLIPFTYLPDSLVALHIVDVFYACATITVIYYILRKAKVKYPLFFSSGLLTLDYFMMRLLIGRAFVFAIALLFLQIWLAIEKRYKTLFFVGIFYVLWHQNTYFMPFVVIVIVEIARYLVEKKLYWKNIIATTLAIIVGMSFFPGFPKSLFGWLIAITQIQSTDVSEVGSGTISGSEIIAKDFMSLFVDKEVLVSLFVFCTVIVLFLYFQQKKKNGNTQTQLVNKQMIWIYTLFIFMITTMFGTIAISGRFFDFLFPTFFMLSAFLFTMIIKSKKIFIDKTLSSFLKSGTLIILFILIANVLIVVWGKVNSFDYEPAQKTAQWIQNNSSQRERVFLTNWTMFTLMFFENSHSVYATGIEPMSLKASNEELYWKYYNMFKYNFYCEKQGDCKKIIDTVSEKLKNTDESVRIKMEKENSRKIINSIKNDFDSKFIVSSSASFTTMILLNEDLIEDYKSFKSEKLEGRAMEFTVFKLK